MTIQQRALWDIIKLMLAAALVGALIQVGIHYLGLAIVGTAIALALLIYFGKMAYDVRVSQLEYEQQRIDRALKEGR